MQKVEKEYLTPEAILSLASDPLTEDFAIEPQSSLDDLQRLRLWEIEGILKCPVIGWCLDIAEQKEILRKEGIYTKGESDLLIHEILVKGLGDENRLSRRIDFWLNRKYQKEVDELSSLEPGQFITRWKASLGSEVFEGFVWVAVTKADLSAEQRKTIFGDVHMETHVRAKQLGHERQRLNQEQKRNERLEETAKEAGRINRILKREKEEFRDQLAVSRRLCESLQNQNQKLEEELSKRNENSLIISLREENAELRAEKDGVLRQIQACQAERIRLENQNNKLLSKLKKQQQIRFQRSNEPGDPLRQISNSSLPDSASSIDLSGRCVLVVGGLTKMEALYRELIEKNYGTFEHHDGRVNTGTGLKELINQVKRADFVLCCIDHSSHTSALVAKKVSKKFKKPFRVLISSSLSNISSTLSTLQNSLRLSQKDKRPLMLSAMKPRNGNGANEEITRSYELIQP